VPGPREIAEQIALHGALGFGPIVRATEDRLYRIAVRILADQTDAEDALQETYLRAYNALAAGRYDERLRMEAWLVTIVTRVSIDSLRNRKRRAAADEAEPRAHASLDEDQLTAIVELGRWVSELAPDQRAAVVLKFMEGMTSAEVAVILGVSEGAVEQRLLRARAALKRREADEPT
jgi:RNA polymerase sigma-70 factor, ECF subfamily